jgi:hypothetical protein
MYTSINAGANTRSNYIALLSRVSLIKFWKLILTHWYPYSSSLPPDTEPW